jgi:hypothetical protein
VVALKSNSPEGKLRHKTVSEHSSLISLTGKVGTRPPGWRLTSPRRTATFYLTAKSFSNNSFDNLAPSSDNRTDLAFVAGSEM